MNRLKPPLQASAVRRQLWRKRLVWLVLLWSASVAALGVVAWIVRLLMQAAGLSA